MGCYCACGNYIPDEQDQWTDENGVKRHIWPPLPKSQASLSLSNSTMLRSQKMEASKDQYNSPLPRISEEAPFARLQPSAHPKPGAEPTHEQKQALFKDTEHMREVVLIQADEATVLTSHNQMPPLNRIASQAVMEPTVIHQNKLPEKEAVQAKVAPVIAKEAPKQPPKLQERVQPNKSNVGLKKLDSFQQPEETPVMKTYAKPEVPAIQGATVQAPSKLQQPPLLTHTTTFFQKHQLQMLGGYFVQPRRGEALQFTQLKLAAPTNNAVKITTKTKGKTGIIAMRPGPEFPLTFVTDVLASCQIQDESAELVIDSPAPSGFVVYIISEGEPVDVTIDGMGKTILELAHGNLKEAPPKMQSLAEKRAQKSQREVVLKTKNYIMHYTVEMHGGFMAQNASGEEIDDNQIIVYATEGNVVTVQASTQGKVGIIALRQDKKFPLQETTDILAFGEPKEGMCELSVTSPGVEGFVIYIMANGQLCTVNIDGNNKMLLGVAHGQDHVPSRRESSVSNSSRSSIMKKAETRGEVRRIQWVKGFEKQITGGPEIDAEEGVDIQDTAQVLVYAPTGNKVKATIKGGSSKLGIIALKRDTFPLEKTTAVIGAAQMGYGEVSLQIESPGPRGIVFYFVGGPKNDIVIDGLGSLLLEVVHAQGL